MGMNNNCIFDKNDLLQSWSLHKVQFWTDLLVKTVWESFIRKIGQLNAIRVTLVFCTKLYRKLAVSQTTFFVPRELVSRTDSWKTPKLGTNVHQYLVSKTVLAIWYSISFQYLLTSFLQIFAWISKHENRATKFSREVGQKCHQSCSPCTWSVLPQPAAAAIHRYSRLPIKPHWRDRSKSGNAAHVPWCRFCASSTWNFRSGAPQLACVFLQNMINLQHVFYRKQRSGGGQRHILQWASSSRMLKPLTVTWRQAPLRWTCFLCGPQLSLRTGPSSV